MSELAPEVTPAEGAAALEVTPTPEEMHQRGLAAARALPNEDGTSPQVATPEVTGTEGAATTPEVDSFTGLDPSTIPPDLQPWYKQMQADYTRKMQAIAPTRAVAEATGLNDQQLTQAAELYNALQDPEQLVSFYGELTQALEANGYTPAQAATAAQEHIATITPAPAEQGGWQDDPEEARIAAMEARIAGFESAQAAEAERQQQERLQMALIGEMNRQEMLVKEQHPTWDQADLDAVYEMSAFYGGSLIDAAARLDEYTSGKITRILNGKAAGADPALAPIVPAHGISRGMDFGDDLDAAHKAALAAVRALPAQQQ